MSQSLSQQSNLSGSSISTHGDLEQATNFGPRAKSTSPVHASQPARHIGSKRQHPPSTLDDGASPKRRRLDAPRPPNAGPQAKEADAQLLLYLSSGAPSTNYMSSSNSSDENNECESPNARTTSSRSSSNPPDDSQKKASSVDVAVSLPHSDRYSTSPIAQNPKVAMQTNRRGSAGPKQSFGPLLNQQVAPHARRRVMSSSPIGHPPFPPFGNGFPPPPPPPPPHMLGRSQQPIPPPGVMVGSGSDDSSSSSASPSFNSVSRSTSNSSSGSGSVYRPPPMSQLQELFALALDMDLFQREVAPYPLTSPLRPPNNQLPLAPPPPPVVRPTLTIPPNPMPPLAGMPPPPLTRDVIKKEKSATPPAIPPRLPPPPFPMMNGNVGSMNLTMMMAGRGMVREERREVEEEERGEDENDDSDSEDEDGDVEVKNCASDSAMDEKMIAELDSWREVNAKIGSVFQFDEKALVAFVKREKYTSFLRMLLQGIEDKDMQMETMREYLGDVISLNNNQLFALRLALKNILKCSGV